MCAFALTSCHNHSSESHAEHEHAHEHSHEHEGHSHDHSAHNHDAHTEHAHGEIVLSPEQAAAAGVKTQQIVAGPFATAIRTSGKITADSGTEMVMVARTSGILSWNGRTPSLGQYVSKGKSIGSVSAESMTGGDAATSYRIAYEAALNKYERAKHFASSRLSRKISSLRLKHSIRAPSMPTRQQYHRMQRGVLLLTPR